MCPVCTIAIGAGLGLSRWLGISDLVSGIWIGGLIVSLIGITINWLIKKGWRFPFLKSIVVILFYFLTIGPLYWAKVIGRPYNRFCGMDKLLFGMIVGSASFLITVWLNYLLNKKNKGKAFFPFQKVVIPVIFLVIASLVLYFGFCR